MYARCNMDITKIDKNFAIKHLPDDVELDFYPATDPIFDLRGVMLDDEGYTRMPREVATPISVGVAGLYRNTSGGRLRFYTDSPTITVAAVSDLVTGMPHFTHIGANGFDLYLDGKPQGSFYAFWRKDGDLNYLLVSKVLPHPGEVEIYLPLYANVTDLKIGLTKGSSIRPTAEKYATEKPVVFYGSSVTQGGCASRAGMSYEAILCRELNLDFVNLGFSGSAKGEARMAEYIASLDMSAFVLDYDYNAHTPEYLAETHRPFFDTVRAAPPDMPIILMTSPKYDRNREFNERAKVVIATYEAAVASGDKNVYLVTADDMFSEIGDEGLIDNCHPTDLGFWAMAKALSPVLKRALGL